LGPLSGMWEARQVLLAAVTLDGVPENLALGVSLVGGASLSLLVAIFFPTCRRRWSVLLRCAGRGCAHGSWC
jgi:hypothetical protein